MISLSTPPTPAFADTKCGGCTALCCHYFALEIDAPDEPEDFENLRWYILHEDIQIFVDDEVWYLNIERKCTWLKDNHCGNYENRPTICREYTDVGCEKDGPESDLLFKNIEELEAYRDDWVAKYEAGRGGKAAKKAARKEAKRGKKKGKGRKSPSGRR